METTAYTGSTRWHELVVNKISLTEPFEWLSKGWKDMRDAGRYSLTYGAGIVLISGLLTFGLVATDSLFLLPFLIAGFFLVAPVIGIGLYQMSAHLEQGEPLKSCNALEAWKRNQGSDQHGHRRVLHHHAALDCCEFRAFCTALCGHFTTARKLLQQAIPVRRWQDVRDSKCLRSASSSPGAPTRSAS